MYGSGIIGGAGECGGWAVRRADHEEPHSTTAEKPIRLVPGQRLASLAGGYRLSRFACRPAPTARVPADYFSILGKRRAQAAAAAPTA